MDEDALRAALSKSYDAIDTVNGLEADLIQSINETRKCVNDSRRELDIIRRNRRRPVADFPKRAVGRLRQCVIAPGTQMKALRSDKVGGPHVTLVAADSISKSAFAVTDRSVERARSEPHKRSAQAFAPRSVLL